MRSVWLKEALRDEGDEVSPTLLANTTADVAIVGGGFTGLWTAIELKTRQPHLDVLIVERDVCGAGASGANGGYALGIWMHAPTIARLHGLQEAVRLCRAADNVIDEIVAFCEKFGIDAEFERKGAIWGATCDAQTGLWADMVRTANSVAEGRYTPLSGEEIESLTGSRIYTGGVIDNKATLLHPGKLVRGLRRVAIALGVRIHENTAMTRLERGSVPAVVCGEVRVRAKKVVLATYAWSINVPELRRSIMVIGTDMLMTEPVPDAIAKLGWDGPAGITDSRNFIQSTRLTRDRRVMLSVAGSWLPYGNRIDRHIEKGSKESIHDLRARLEKFYPLLRDVGIQGSWSGAIDRSKSGLPLFGPLPGSSNIFYGFGYSGTGLIMTKLGAKILASLVLEEDDEWKDGALVRRPESSFPREPFRYLGSHVIAKAIARKDTLDHQGKAVGPITRYALRFKPGSYKPT